MDERMTIAAAAAKQRVQAALGPVCIPASMGLDWEEIGRLVDAERRANVSPTVIEVVVSRVKGVLNSQAYRDEAMGVVADHAAEVHAAHVRAEMIAEVLRTRETWTASSLEKHVLGVLKVDCLPPAIEPIWEAQVERVNILGAEEVERLVEVLRRQLAEASTKQDRFYTGDQLRAHVLKMLGWAYVPPELEEKMASWNVLAAEANKGGEFVETLIKTLRKDGNALISGARKFPIQPCEKCATGREAGMREVKCRDGEPFVTVDSSDGRHVLRWWYCPACGATTFATEARERPVAKAPRAGAGWQLTAEDRHVLFDAINDRGEVLAAGGTIADLERAANEVLHVVREIATGAVSEFAAWLLRQEEWDKESCEDAAEQFIGETNSSSPAEWTRVAPTVPGYYWGRDEDGVRMYQRNDDGLWLVIDSENAIRPQDVVEWWPIPVEPPA